MMLDRRRILRSVARNAGKIVAAATLFALIGGVPSARSAPTELVMWNIPLSKAYTQFWKDYVETFNKAHPEIHVAYEEFDTETLKTKMRAALLAGTEPDIWFFFPGEFTTVNHRRGKVRPINDIVPVSDYTAEAIGRCSDGDSVICLPLFFGPSALYYNKALFAKAEIDPAKWSNPERPTIDEFNAAIEKLGAAGVTPLALANSGKWPLMFYYWAAQNRFGGVDVLNNAVLGQNGGSYNSESFIKAGEFVRDLIRRNAVSSGFNGMASAEMYAQFTRGDAAMIYMGPWIISIAKEQAKTLDYGLFDFPSIPAGKAEAQTDMMAGLDALFVSKSTKNAKAVGEFLSGFSKPETARWFMIETNNISTVKGVLEDVIKSGQASEKLASLAQLMANAGHTYQWWDWLLPPVAAEAMLSVSQPLSTGNLTPEQAAAQLESAARSNP
jgi:raffinose/stachyose/melibiose transport system substrate-binding protein